MVVRPVLRLGDPRLRLRSAELEAAGWEPRSPPMNAGLGGKSTMAALLPAGGLFSASAAAGA